MACPCFTYISNNPEPEFEPDGPPSQCTGECHGKSHAEQWVFSGTAYGGDDESYFGEGRCYCAFCGEDGDG